MRTQLMRAIASKNIGRFYIDHAFFYGLGTGEGMNMFNRMVVLEATSSFTRCQTEYTAIHPHFEPIHPGQEIPLYKATWQDGSAYPKWERCTQPPPTPETPIDKDQTP